MRLAIARQVTQELGPDAHGRRPEALKYGPRLGNRQAGHPGHDGVCVDDLLGEGAHLGLETDALFVGTPTLVSMATVAGTTTMSAGTSSASALATIAVTAASSTASTCAAIVPLRRNASPVAPTSSSAGGSRTTSAGVAVSAKTVSPAGTPVGSCWYVVRAPRRRLRTSTAARS